MFYTPASASQRSTLFNIREKFGHRNVKGNVSNCINHVLDLLRVTTESMVCFLGMNVFGMATRDSVPPDCPPPPPVEASVDERWLYIKTACKDIVETIWPSIDQCHIYEACFDEKNDADDAGDQTYCVCDRDKGEVIF